MKSESEERRVKQPQQHPNGRRAKRRSPTLPSSLFTLYVFLIVALSACREAFTTDVAVVARAGNSELTVDRLAEIFAQGKALALKRDVIERVARLWVDYSLFAERAAAGDSLLDSATVVTTMWPEVQQRLADHFHETLVAGQVKLDSARLDSTYAAGDYRLFEHILLRTEPTIAPPAKEAKRLRAEAIRARLVAGGSWAEANRSNDDPQAKSTGGSLGVLVRGEMPPPLEDAAFTLQPGRISNVVETPEGFHILRRPALRERRAAFASGVENRIVERMDSAYFSALGERRHIRVKSDAPAVARAALADPLKAATSKTVLGTFDGGSFTVGGLIRWINAMPVQVQQQVSRADDGQIAQFLRSLMRNEALIVEAQNAGVGLTPLDIEEFRDILRRDLVKVRAAIALDAKTLADSGASDEQKRRVAALHVDQYLEQLANNRTGFVSVPPFLAARLRERSTWSVTSAGIDRVLERSTELRAMVDSLRPVTPAPAEPADSGAANVRE